MQFEIEQGELELAHHCHRGAGMAAVVETLEQLARQRLVTVDVRRAMHEHFVVPCEVLHELARQLNRVPGHAVDAGNARVIHSRQQVVQHVAELVEQGDDVFVCEQRAVIATAVGRRKVADEIAHRQHRMAIEVLADDALVDPGAVALARARIEVRVETPDQSTTLVPYGVVANVVMPIGNGVLLLEPYAVESLGGLEQAVYYDLRREIPAQRLVRDRVLGLFEFLEPVRGIPRRDRIAGQRLQLG